MQRAEATQRVEALSEEIWELVKIDPAVRYGAIGAVSIVWLAIALLNVWLLFTLPFVYTGVVLYRRRRGPLPEVGVEDDPDLY
jgi:hypothetical protein